MNKASRIVVVDINESKFELARKVLSNRFFEGC
jgi:threonine dehydrogenase-like Zn-dependent dehydrogenase